jgi:gas vesicle protein
MSSSKALLGFVAGAAVGALAGILFAPDKGSNTRSKIAHKAGDWKEAAKSSINGIIDSVKDVYSGAKDEAEDLGDRAKAKMNTAKSEVKNSFS